MNSRLVLFVSLYLSAGGFSVRLAAEPTALKLTDVLAWKRIQTPIISNDGEWFAYKLVPNDGDAEVVLTHVSDGKEQRFPIGEVARPNPYANIGAPEPMGPPHDLAFSDDSKWLAFDEHPTQKQAHLLKKQHKPLHDKVLLVEVATGKKTEFDGIKRFAFSGERSSAIALQRYPPTPAGAPQPPPDAEAKPDDNKPQGSDLIVVELASGNQLSVGNVSDFAFDKKGDWLAWLVDAQDKLGNGIELRNMKNGDVVALDSAKASYKALNWTEKGDGLAAVRGVEDKQWEDKLYTLVAFKGFADSSTPEKFVYDPTKDKSFPAAMTVSAERRPAWMADLSVVTFGIHERKPKEKNAKDTKDAKDAQEVKEAKEPDGEDSKASKNKPEDDKPDQPDLVIWHWKDPRPQPMQQVQENRDKNFSFLCSWDPVAKKFTRLADPALKDVNAAPESKYGVGIDIREYELEGNLDGKRYQDIYRVDLKTGERKLALRKARWYQGPASPDGTHLLYYENGAFFTYDLTDGQSYNLTKDIPAIFYNTEDDHNVIKPPTRSIGWTKDSQYVLISDNWDIYKVPANGGAAVNLTGNGKTDKIRYLSIWRLNPDDKGFDLSKPLYVRAYGEWTKKGGIGVIEPGKSGMRMLHWDDAAYANLVKAKNADVYAYSRETTQEYPDYYAAGPSLDSEKKVTDANPQQKDFLWTKGYKLVEYTNSRGEKSQGVIYLPANYEAGKKYPTIVYIYEKLSQAANTYPQPSFGSGFSIGYYTSNGYAVLTPDITYKVNDPGTSSIACILAALKAAEATGIVDPQRVALHGHSWGGYQTAFGVTQTKVFRAAIAGAPLTDMISMYSSIYWNTGSANQPIFESSQGRFAGGYWDNMEAYIRNSPVYHAVSVQTPLLILCDDKDGAVDHTQGIEYYNTLRRLGKPVVMLEYKGENHGLIKPEDMKDYSVRVKEFFDYYLMDKPAPKWWTDGVPRLKIKEELEQRQKELTKPVISADMAAPAQ